MGKIALRISDETDSFLDFMAKESGMSKSEVIRFAISSFQFRAMVGEYKLIADEGRIQEFTKKLESATDYWPIMLADITKERKKNMSDNNETKKDSKDRD